MGKASGYTWVTLVTLVMVIAAAPAARAASDRIVASFDAPSNYAYGVAYGGGNLYVSDVVSMTIYRLNRTTGSVISSFVPSPKPSGFMYGLAYSSGYLWADTLSPTRVFKIAPGNGSVVASYTLSGISMGTGLGADADYLYIASNTSLGYIYKTSVSGGSIVASWSGAKNPSGTTRITHIPTTNPVVLNLGHIDGWVRIYDLNGTEYGGQQFKIDPPCGTGNYGGDLATRNNRYIFYVSSYLKLIYELKINWSRNEYPSVTPTSFGSIKALYR